MLEIILAIGFTLMAWTLVILTLPLGILIKSSKTLRRLIFRLTYVDVTGYLIHAMLKPCRRSCFQLLGEHLKDRDESIPLKVLEIGIYHGPNLEFYPNNVLLTALDIDASLVAKVKENLQKQPQVKLERMVCSMAEDMKEVDTNSMDLVICTYVLCTVTDVSSALREVKRVLKPGGKFLFMEHVSYPKNDIRFMLQRMILPIWYTLTDGCQFRTNDEELLERAGFSNLNYSKLYPSHLLVYVRPQILGVAIK